MDETCVLKCSDAWEGQTDAASFHLTSESKVIFKKRPLSNQLKAHSALQSGLRNPFNHNHKDEFNVTVALVFHRHKHLHWICVRYSVLLCCRSEVIKNAILLPVKAHS